MDFAELRPQTRVTGLAPAAVVTIVAVTMHGRDAASIVYRHGNGKLGEDLLLRSHLERLAPVTAEPPDPLSTGYSPMAIGNDDGWAAYVGRAWVAVADVRGKHVAPPLPAAMRSPRSGPSLGGSSQGHAYWRPLLHLLVMGLGWRSVRVGLRRWLDAGSPTDSPVLAVVDRWWGPYLPSFIGSSTAASTDDYLRGFFDEHAAPVRSEAVPQRCLEDPDWDHLWSGGTDPMHLAFHFHCDLQLAGEPTGLTIGADETRRACLLTDAYAGWYSTLYASGLTQNSVGASWRVDVVVKPLGWLGTYRISRDTGAWFSGRHRWHALGW
ncbi:hypothetical protein KOI35_42565 [Actinoplanes bogorensis]|uniref:Uncharacterized protein n=1 Tax=Paractinoplanes bogorensis TaxID=1610840 RepID=A0ABS5Z3D7_9ACTN|nr:hypothetical protein [Actinoplanes bogorensis]MBU2670205.1 hypothetical protein [Actinoplanes bogorensis]